jgi:hypothetical protein
LNPLPEKPQQSVAAFNQAIKGETHCEWFTFQKSGLKPPTSVGKDFNCAPQAL